MSHFDPKKPPGHAWAMDPAMLRLSIVPTRSLGYNSSHSMQLLGNFGTFYVILSECAGAMPMVPAPSLLMTHVPHDAAKSSSLSSHATKTTCLRLP